MSKRKLPEKTSASSAAIEPKTSDSLATIEPKVGIAIIGLFSALPENGDIAALEDNFLVDLLSQIALYDDYSEEELEALNDQVIKLFKEENRDELIARAFDSLSDRGYRDAAYVVAILVTGIDEEVPESEQEYISDLQEYLNISDERAEQLIDLVYGIDDDEDYDEDDDDE